MFVLTLILVAFKGINEFIIATASTDNDVHFIEGETLSYVSAVADAFVTDGGTASQFVKGDGTLDSTTYITSASIQDWLRADVADTAAGKITFSAGFDDTDTTGLGRVGNLGLAAIVATTDWANLPVGYSRGVNTSTTTGEPSGANHGYFTKIANRDVSGGWGGLWIVRPLWKHKD